LIAECDGPFKAHLDRYKYPNRYDLPDGLAQRAQGSVFLADLEARLARTAYLAGSAWGLPDAAIAPFVRQWAHTDPAWFAAQAWSNLQAWLNAWECSAGFDLLMRKYAAWRPGDAPVWWTAQ
jgi:glutathione S-transferase